MPDKPGRKERGDLYERCPAHFQISQLKKIVENGLSHQTKKLTEDMAEVKPMVKILWKLQWWQIGLMVGLIGVILFAAYEVVTNIINADKQLESSVNELLRSLPK